MNKKMAYWRALIFVVAIVGIVVAAMAKKVFGIFKGGPKK
jgi:hypothetical protein